MRGVAIEGVFPGWFFFLSGVVFFLYVFQCTDRWLKQRLRGGLGVLDKVHVCVYL